MTTAQTQTIPARPSTRPLEAGACAVCPHPLAAHDAISLRFCSRHRGARRHDPRVRLPAALTPRCVIMRG